MTTPSTRNSLSEPQVRASLISRMRIDREAFGAWSESFARYLGTSSFLVQMTIFIAIWLLWNTLAPAPMRFDPYTFTFLTLLLSLQASYAAPLILLAQNRQDDRDRLSLEEDRRRAAQTKADTEYLARELASLRMNMSEVATRDYLRGEVERLRSDLAELTAALQAAGVAAATLPDNPAKRGAKSKKAKRGNASDTAGKPKKQTAKPATGRAADGQEASEPGRPG